AGLTERTFFRYFTDKREVLFAGSESLNDALVGAVDAAAPSLAPIDAMAAALDAVGAIFDGRHEFARMRARIVAEHAELQERELIKLARLRVALADALRRRGVPQSTASLIGDMGIAVFHNAFARWVSGDGEQTLGQMMRDSLRELKTVAAGGSA
ncbi:MAG TPA: hypothetical protein VGN14_19235, partial [Candidatus Elarobacter sp.]